MSEYHPTRGPLRQALNLIAHSVKGQGKPEVWVDRILDTWHAETTHLSVEAIKLGAQTWIRSESFRPSLADFLTLCEMTRTTEEKERGARGCPDCLGTGWRWFYVHHHAPGSRRKCDSHTAACVCPKGQLYSQSQKSYSIVQAIADARKVPGFIAVYSTDRDNPRCAAEETMTPEDYERLRSRGRRAHFGVEV